MKTALQLPSASANAPRRGRGRGRPADGWGPTIRLGVVFSVTASVVATGLRVATNVPSALLVVAAAVVGFTLSWHATWHPRSDTYPDGDHSADAPAPPAHR